jgi:RHS repeat-associated protein
VNRYVHKASEVPTHDEDGNQTGDGRWHYRWDAENRLVEMETTTAATTAGAPYGKVRWTYDPLGRRIQRQTWQGANPVVVTKYVYDGLQCIAELDGSNVVTATYAWGKDLSGTRTGAGGVGGLLWVHHAQHGWHFYAYDGNGNVCGLTSATDGTRSGGYEYDPFGGVIRVDAGNPVVSWNEWQFSAKRKDPVAEVVLYEYRGYEVRTGRWLGRDPIEEDGGGHLSGFVENSPLILFDPLGDKVFELRRRNQVCGCTYHWFVVIRDVKLRDGKTGIVVIDFSDTGMAVLEMAISLDAYMLAGKVIDPNLKIVNEMETTPEEDAALVERIGVIAPNEKYTFLWNDCRSTFSRVMGVLQEIRDPNPPRRPVYPTPPGG